MNKNYIKTMIRYLKQISKKINHNFKLQRLYNANEDIYDFFVSLMEYSLKQNVFYLASGISCYFNNQIEMQNISRMKLAEQDKEDAKFIAHCFGKEITYGHNNLPILYTTLLGPTVLNYAMQTFPAGIFEDVFQCSASHELPIQPLVGESEIDYYCRVLEYQISRYANFPMELKSEVLFRGKRLIKNFCIGKNRVYLIPINNVLNNKASFGDVIGLRDGKIKEAKLNEVLNSLITLRELLQQYHIAPDNLYGDSNMTSEDGIAIYGDINQQGITYFEVDRLYELMQKKAIQLGYLVGTEISKDILSTCSKKH